MLPTLQGMNMSMWTLRKERWVILEKKNKKITLHYNIITSIWPPLSVFGLMFVCFHVGGYILFLQLCFWFYCCVFWFAVMHHLHICCPFLALLPCFWICYCVFWFAVAFLLWYHVLHLWATLSVPSKIFLDHKSSSAGELLASILKINISRCNIEMSLYSYIQQT